MVRPLLQEGVSAKPMEEKTGRARAADGQAFLGVRARVGKKRIGALGQTAFQSE